MPQTDKPPLGIMPERIWRQKRIDALNDAINRYIDSGSEKTALIALWIAEADRHAAWTERYGSRLAALAKVRETADAYGAPDFASRIGMKSLEHEERRLRDELRAADERKP